MRTSIQKTLAAKSRLITRRAVLSETAVPKIARRRLRFSRPRNSKKISMKRRKQFLLVSAGLRWDRRWLIRRALRRAFRKIPHPRLHRRARSFATRATCLLRHPQLTKRIFARSVIRLRIKSFLQKYRRLHTRISKIALRRHRRIFHKHRTKSNIKHLRSRRHLRKARSCVINLRTSVRTLRPLFSWRKALSNKLFRHRHKRTRRLRVLRRRARLSQKQKKIRHKRRFGKYVGFRRKRRLYRLLQKRFNAPRKLHRRTLRGWLLLRRAIRRTKKNINQRLRHYRLQKLCITNKRRFWKIWQKTHKNNKIKTRSRALAKSIKRSQRRKNTKSAVQNWKQKKARRRLRLRRRRPWILKRTRKYMRIRRRRRLRLRRRRSRVVWRARFKKNKKLIRKIIRRRAARVNAWVSAISYKSQRNFTRSIVQYARINSQNPQLPHLLHHEKILRTETFSYLRAAFRARVKSYRRKRRKTIRRLRRAGRRFRLRRRCIVHSKFKNPQYRRRRQQRYLHRRRRKHDKYIQRRYPWWRRWRRAPRRFYSASARKRRIFFAFQPNAFKRGLWKFHYRDRLFRWQINKRLILKNKLTRLQAQTVPAQPRQIAWHQWFTSRLIAYRLPRVLIRKHRILRGLIQHRIRGRHRAVLNYSYKFKRQGSRTRFVSSLRKIRPVCRIHFWRRKKLKLRYLRKPPSVLKLHSAKSKRLSLITSVLFRFKQFYSQKASRCICHRNLVANNKALSLELQQNLYRKTPIRLHINTDIVLRSSKNSRKRRRIAISSPMAVKKERRGIAWSVQLRHKLLSVRRLLKIIHPKISREPKKIKHRLLLVENYDMTLLSSVSATDALFESTNA